MIFNFNYDFKTILIAVFQLITFCFKNQIIREKTIENERIPDKKAVILIKN